MEEMRRKVIEHEKRSRASEAKRSSNPRLTFMLSGPLFFTAIVLYGLSFYGAKQFRKFLHEETNDKPSGSAQTANDDKQIHESTSEILLDTDQKWRWSNDAVVWIIPIIYSTSPS